jgi:hypothetical protein
MGAYTNAQQQTEAHIHRHYQVNTKVIHSKRSVSLRYSFITWNLLNTCKLSLQSSALKTHTAGFSETLVPVFQTTRCQISEVRNLHGHQVFHITFVTEQANLQCATEVSNDSLTEEFLITGYRTSRLLHMIRVQKLVRWAMLLGLSTKKCTRSYKGISCLLLTFGVQKKTRVE